METTLSLEQTALSAALTIIVIKRYIEYGISIGMIYSKKNEDPKN